MLLLERDEVVDRDEVEREDIGISSSSMREGLALRDEAVSGLRRDVDSERDVVLLVLGDLVAIMASFLFAERCPGYASKLTAVAQEDICLRAIRAKYKDLAQRLLIALAIAQAGREHQKLIGGSEEVKVVLKRK